MTKYQIVSDSSCDLSANYLEDKDIGFQIVPFVVQVGERAFADTPDLSVDEMLDAIDASGAKTGSACPSPEAYYQAMMQSEVSFVVTISSGLSGSYNSACVARDMAIAQGKRVYVIDSKATCGVQILIIDELARLIRSGYEYERICEDIETFCSQRKLLFVLRNFDNLIRNGRILKIVAKVISALNICPICAKTEQGTIEIREKLIGIKKTLKRLVTLVGENIRNFAAADIIINHCQASEEAEQLEHQIKSSFPEIGKVRIIPMRGLASYYAQRKGLIVSF